MACRRSVGVPSEAETLSPKLQVYLYILFCSFLFCTDNYVACSFCSAFKSVFLANCYVLFSDRTNTF